MTNEELVDKIVTDTWTTPDLVAKFVAALDAKDRLYAAAWAECEAWREWLVQHLALEADVAVWGSADKAKHDLHESAFQELAKARIAHDAAREEAGL